MLHKLYFNKAVINTKKKRFQGLNDEGKEL